VGGNTNSHIRNSSWLLCIYHLLSLLCGMMNAHRAPWQRPCFLSLIGYCWRWLQSYTRRFFLNHVEGVQKFLSELCTWTPFGKLMLQCLDRQHCRMQAAWTLSPRGLAVFHILLDCNLYIFRQG
jgi:hypothetical protein